MFGFLKNKIKEIFGKTKETEETEPEPPQTTGGGGAGIAPSNHSQGQARFSRLARQAP